MSLDEALNHHFGYRTFRPLQREIAESVLAGRDVVALLPTGGGKSLCYQLPALLQPGLTLVISPLIALMKDQVDALTASGIEATYLNSSIDAQSAAERIDGLDRGTYRLLYVAPERAVMPSFVRALPRWNVQLIAVDEAHCVSEWGHEFRPEYRRIAELRRHLPNVPVLALTATATARVRSDIERALELRAPERFVAGFNRPNLRYSVFEKRDAVKQLLNWCTARPSESGIIYTQSRTSAEDLAQRLSAAGIAARPYHAGLTAAQRARNQELFIRDDVRVICATIAFGMGIDKPNVRYVVHYDLPKSIEGYYQETGRAGRDGLPSECALFFSGGDAAKQRHFIRQIAEDSVREQAERLLHAMLGLASTPHCRRAHMLRYLGEVQVSGECGNCDNCLQPPESIDGTTAAQKILSCVYRICAAGFATGEQHVLDVLLGRSTDKVRSWRHDKLSTFGVGTEHGRPAWQSFISELLRTGELEKDAERRTLTLTQEGLNALRHRRTFTFFKPRAVAPKTKGRRSTEELAPASEEVFQNLRALRKQLADEQGVPPYVIFSDATLREIAARKPATLSAFRAVSGVGDTKLERYGRIFLDAIDRASRFEASMNTHSTTNGTSAKASDTMGDMTPQA